LNTYPGSIMSPFVQGIRNSPLCVDCKNCPWAAVPTIRSVCGCKCSKNLLESLVTNRSVHPESAMAVADEWL
jgi:hypothetical protein